MKTNLILACSLAGLFIGCGDLKENLPAATQTIGVHPSGWLTKTSSDFHGQAIEAMGWDIASGKPNRQTLADLGLNELTGDL